MAYEDKGAARGVLPTLSGTRVFQTHRLNALVSYNLSYDGIPNEIDLFAGKGALLQSGSGAQLVAPMDDGNLARKAGQEERLFHSAVAAANDDDILVFEKPTIARGAITHTAPGELVFPRTGEEWVYDPRMFITTGIFYAMEPKRPIQHLHEISWLIAQWVAWKNGAENAYVSSDVVRSVARRFWGSELAGDFSTYEGKALAAKKIQDRQYVKESLILCDYSWPIAHVRYSEDHLGDPSIESKIFSAVVGKEVDEEGLYRIGERVFNLQRAILAREGHRGKESDTLPEFSYTMPLQQTEHNPDCLLPGKDGEPITRKGKVVEKDKFEVMMDEYYSLRGWDAASGLQTETKLKQLDLQDVAADLLSRGLLA